MTKAGFSKDRLSRLHHAMAGYVERGEMPGVVALVWRNGETHVDAVGKLAFEAHEPMRRDTLFRIASMTKPIIAAAAMILVEECVLRLDEPVDRFLPELANRRVLKQIDGPLEDTVPAKRGITLRDLLTFRLGIGAVMAPPDSFPIQTAMKEAGFAPGPNPPAHVPDDWMKNLSSLPLVHHPGETWMYHIGSDILGVLIARASGMTLGRFLKERIFDPLGMKDTGFSVSIEQAKRLATSYMLNPGTGELVVHDSPLDSRWSNPAFESGGGGLVSTVDDYLAFCLMMLGKGSYGSTRILSRPSVELMTSDQLTQEQKGKARIFFADHSSWGFGMGVNIRRDQLWSTPGRFGWDGGVGTSGYSDPAENMVGILMTQRMMQSPEPPRVFVDFWTSAYQAIDE
ncbi:serine hydrolase domain-containing protein [Brevibacillus choshinensis]|uniref:Beta-lactamase family protein n=1 Tax=Brevibacillus choshinensis TaxID=54911 RepID=A0ABX7FQM2_BRECH|nr:serine hydrolase domain-containing protein [Brevibacillus choshinensis]QRG68462.1 beta-lactamase family protein [Brevibacillus choshinensis]